MTPDSDRPAAEPDNARLEERLEKQLGLLKRQVAERRQAEEALRQEGQARHLLLEVAAAANAARTIEEAVQFALDRVCEYTGWPLGGLYLLSADKRQVVSGGLWHCDEPAEHFDAFRRRSEAGTVPIGAGWTGQVFGQAKPLWMLNLAEDQFLLDALEGSTEALKTGFVFPVSAGDEVVAALAFFTLDEVEPDGRLLELMAYIGSQLGRVFERVRAEEALRASERENRAVLEQTDLYLDQMIRNRALLAEAERLAGLGSWEWDLAAGRMSWSDELYAIYGLNPAAFEPTLPKFIDLALAEDRAYVRQAIEDAQSSRDPFELYHRIRRPEGAVRVLHVRAKCVLADDGRLARIIGTSQDVTQRLETEARLARRAQQLASLNEIGQTVAASFDLEVVFGRLLAELRPLLGAQGLFILLLEGNALVFSAADLPGGAALKGQRVPVEAGPAGETPPAALPAWAYSPETRRRLGAYLEDVAGYQAAALLAMPLRLRGELIGLIIATHNQADAFHADALQLLELAAAWTAVAIGNARQFEAQGQARQTAETLRDANVAFTQTLNLDTILNTFLDYLQRLVGFAYAAVVLQDRAGPWRLWGLRGGRAGETTPERLESSAHPRLEAMFAGGAGFYPSDPLAGERTPLPAEPDGLRSWLYIPLWANDQVVGVCVIGREEAGYFGEQQRLLAEALAAQTAAALQNAWLYAQMQAAGQRLEYLTRQVVAAQEQERGRVSRELHDEAGQLLTALKLNLALMRSKLPAQQAELRQQLGEALELADTSMEQIRRLAHGLRPPALDTLGLNQALELLCQDFARRAGLRIEYRGVELARTSDAIAISCFRFVQEALVNVIRHAEASRVEVALAVEDGLLSLSVADDGHGFQMTSGAAKGIGLRGLQERFELIGGRVQVDSQPGQGTRLSASVSLPPAAEGEAS
ncbi:MAG: GAF domain-containing protein [Candidatus Promineifilaceae bacterium]